ncbi:MAG TPA: DMT family transporter [Sedimentisphaerales bacterium]|nr:DMT family transporter [Sedimentisphaerales bacterium]
MLSKTHLLYRVFIAVTSDFLAVISIFLAIMNSKKTGILAILGASIMWSLEPVFAKLAYANSDYLQTSAIRAIVVVLTALLYVLITGVRKLKVTSNQFSKILYIAIAGTIIGDLLYFFALTKVSVLNAVLIGHMQPVFIILIGFFFLKDDKLTKFDYIGIFTMIIAAVFVTTKTLENLSMMKLGTVGDVYVLLATVAWATTAIVTRKYLRELNAGVVTFYRYLIASVIFVVYLSLKSSLVLSNIYQILVGVVVGVGTILYYESMKRIKAAQVSAMELSTPFFVALLGFLILGEGVTVMQISGLVLLFVGVCFLSKKEEAYF